MSDGPSRPYHSPRRQQQAAETRQRILDAARVLFADEGYGTTIAEIAKRAQVSPQTVTAAFGTKSGLMAALVESLDIEAGLPALLAGLGAASGDPVRQIELVIGFDLDLWERGGEVLAVAHAVRSVEPDAAQIIAQGRERGREGRRRLARSWEEAGQLRPELTADEAAEAFLSLTGYDHYRQLVTEAGWSRERFASYLRDLVAAAVLDPATRSDAPGAAG